MRKIATHAVLGLILCLCVLVSTRVEVAAQNSNPATQPALSKQDRALLLQALRLARQNRWLEVQTVLPLAKDPLVRDVVQWVYFTKGAGPADFSEVTSLIRRHPDWPKRGALTLRAEKAMPANLPDSSIVAWFKDYPPKTYDALNRYLDALQRQGRVAEVRKVAGEWWRGSQLTPEQQRRLYSEYGSMIGVQDHLIRLNKIMDDKAYANARGIASVLGRGYPALVEARIALQQDDPRVNALVSAVPSNLQRDPGLMLERLRWRRKKDMDVAAIEMLHSMPAGASNVDAWWNERQILARRLMDRRQYQSAYLLVAKHGLKEGASYAEAEFLAGWLALTFTKQPWKAFEHFERLYNTTATPISRARGAYWAGRASDALGHSEVARPWYQVGAQNQTTFYGQLAAGRLSSDYKPPRQSTPARTVQGENRFNSLAMTQAARALNEAGFRQETTDFLNALSDSVTKAEEFLYVAELSRDLDHLHNAVRIAKKGITRGVVLMDHAFPTILQRMKGQTTEWALIHALIRQESQFDYAATSPVGARGLMQLMPATAAETSKKLGIPFNANALTANPDYNIRLGSYYIQKLIERYDGSYPLALAAYNAGGGRVNRWLKENGDPRRGEIDIVDWIEMIPYSETRNYVQRVMEGLAIYRMKLRNVQDSYNGPTRWGVQPR